MHNKFKHEFDKRLVFSDEVLFQTNGKVNRDNVCIWGGANCRATIEREGNSLEVNVFCAISKKHIHAPFPLEDHIAGDVCLQMLQNWKMDELIANKHEDFFYQQDGTPPH